MKYLTLMRHAKSSWKDSTLDDFERPLNGRGKRNARLMGRRLAIRDDIPQVIISSPAKRARRTAQLVAEALNYHESAILFEPCIYDAEVGTLVELVSLFEDAWQDVLLIGHNPGLTELVNLFAPCKLDNIVTCGMAKIAFEAASWSELRFNSGRLLFYDYPKKSGE